MVGGLGKLSALLAAGEMGAPEAAGLRAALLARPGARALALKTLVQTAKGSLPLRLT